MEKIIIPDICALVGVVTNKYRYVKMTYNAGSPIPASKIVHVVGDKPTTAKLAAVK
jgi:hypothetical protein